MNLKQIYYGFAKLSMWEEFGGENTKVAVNNGYGRDFL
jgi:hypothetical protein